MFTMIFTLEVKQQNRSIISAYVEKNVGLMEEKNLYL